MIHVFPIFTSETRWYDSLVLTSTVVPLMVRWPVLDFPQHRLVFLIDCILRLTTWFVRLGRVVDHRCICAMNFSLFRLVVAWNLGLSYANFFAVFIEDWFPDEFEVSVPTILPCLASCVFLITTHNTLPLILAQRRQKRLRQR